MQQKIQFVSTILHSPDLVILDPTKRRTATHADLRERDLLDRGDLSAGPASAMAVRHALAVAGIEADDLATIDLYSCFPAPVFNICDGLGLDPADPRNQ